MGVLLEENKAPGYTVQYNEDGSVVETFPAGKGRMLSGTWLLQDNPAGAVGGTAIVTGGTIPSNGAPLQRLNPVAAVTGIIVAKGTAAATDQPQMLVVVNESAFVIEYAAAATSNVSNGAGGIIPAGLGQILIWDPNAQLWFVVDGPIIIGQTPATGAAPAPANGGTIAVNAQTSRVNPAANITGVILALPGDPSTTQVVQIYNESAFNIVFAASGTSNVNGGTGVGVMANCVGTFVFNSVTALWEPVSGTFSSGQNPLTGASTTIVSTNTISTTIGSQRVQEAGAVTGIILAVGTFAGQQVTILNESNFAITMAAAGTSNVANGVTAVIAALAAGSFEWNPITALWYKIS